MARAMAMARAGVVAMARAMAMARGGVVAMDRAMAMARAGVVAMARVDCIVIVQWHIAGLRRRPDRGGGSGAGRGMHYLLPRPGRLPHVQATPVGVQAPRL
jgi:hypothetical protein